MDGGRDGGGRMERMDRLLRKKELLDAVGVAKSTLADWVIEFHMYIPTVKQGAVTYYRPEAIDVLNAIKDLRQLDYAKPQILELLAKRGFPITVEEAVEDVQKIVSQADARDTLLNVMQTMGLAVAEIGKQTDRMNLHEEVITKQSERLDGQDGRIVELEKTLLDLKRELDTTREELAITREQANKSLWRRLFGK
jgi:DNA-binding transcriptional MerR regulator